MGERPGYLVGGEVATLLDRGFQKFWKSSRLEVPATADSLQAVHRFAEELREVIGEPSLYNESLGTTSDSYLYDRVKGRDLPLAQRPTPAWELPPKKVRLASALSRELAVPSPSVFPGHEEAKDSLHSQTHERSREWTSGSTRRNRLSFGALSL